MWEEKRVKERARGMARERKRERDDPTGRERVNEYLSKAS